ncbi:hypothetical protein D3C87_1318390 [compost metagenome]
MSLHDRVNDHFMIMKLITLCAHHHVVNRQEFSMRIRFKNTHTLQLVRFVEKNVACVAQRQGLVFIFVSEPNIAFHFEALFQIERRFCAHVLWLEVRFLNYVQRTTVHFNCRVICLEGFFQMLERNPRIYRITAREKIHGCVSVFRPSMNS